MAAMHDHGHSHAPKNFGSMFAVAMALNLGLVAVQVFYGIVAHSVALLADARHNFGDALGLVIAWGAHVLARLDPLAFAPSLAHGWRSCEGCERTRWTRQRQHHNTYAAYIPNMQADAAVRVNAWLR